MSPEQFTRHILPTKNKLYRFALSYLHAEEDARDIVQEVLLAAWEKVRGNNSLENPEAWCMTLTRNKSLNLLKKKGRNYLPLADQKDLNSPNLNPLEQTAVSEAGHRIRQIMAALPENQAAVARLRDIEGYSYKEIAEILQIEMNHVKVLLFRARKKIKETLIRDNQYGISKAG